MATTTKSTEIQIGDMVEMRRSLASGFFYANKGIVRSITPDKYATALIEIEWNAPVDRKGNKISTANLREIQKAN